MIVQKLGLIFLLSLLFLPSIAFSLTVGVAPGVVELDEVQRGSDYIIEFYLQTDYGKDLVVDLSSDPIQAEIYSPSRYRNYDFNAYESSQEDAYEWIEFIENPVILPPEKKLFALKGGGGAWANLRVEAILHVPDDAEPGYHLASIGFTPRIDTQGQGMGVSIITLTRLTVVFRVPGPAVRSGYIAGFNSKRNENVETIDVIFKNNGTTTIHVRADPIDIYEKNINKTLRSNSQYIEPNRIAILSSNWNVENVEAGTYNISAVVSWLTGNAYREGEIIVAPIGEVIPSPVPEEFPLWILIVIVFIIIIFLIYYAIK